MPVLRPCFAEITCLGGIAGKGDLSVSSLPVREKNRRSANVPLQVPLQGLYWLEQADEDRVDDLALSDQVRFLTAATTIGVRDRMFMTTALELAGEVVARVPVKVLKFRKSQPSGRPSIPISPAEVSGRQTSVVRRDTETSDAGRKRRTDSGSPGQTQAEQ